MGDWVRSILSGGPPVQGVDPITGTYRTFSRETYVYGCLRRLRGGHGIFHRVGTTVGPSRQGILDLD